MREEFLPFSSPLIESDEIEEVVDTLESNWVTTGPKTSQFERLFAKSLNAPGALALNSCTAGLHLALTERGIGEGDEVVVPVMTFCSTANVVEHTGARPRFVDVDPETMNIDPEDLERKINDRTEAVIPVHFAGHPVKLDTINSMANQHNLHVIEDAAHALPAKYKGETIGSGANPTAFSFYATKTLTTGEGGMLTGEEEFVERCRPLSLHGMSEEAWQRYGKQGDWHYDVVAPGYKYNMTDIQASLGIQQLKKMNPFQEKRREIVKTYNDAFVDHPALRIPVERSYVDHAWHLYVLRLNIDRLSIDRNDWIEELADRNIGTSVHFIPLHRFSFYRKKYGYSPGDFPVAEKVYREIVSLPLTPSLSSEDVDDVIEAVLAVTNKYEK